MNEENVIHIDPLDYTPVNNMLGIIPLEPTPWDEFEDGQQAVTADGCVYVRREGLWYRDPWWQGCDHDEIVSICENRGDGWAYDNGWSRKHIEDAYGPITPIDLSFGSLDDNGSK